MHIAAGARVVVNVSYQVNTVFERGGDDEGRVVVENYQSVILMYQYLTCSKNKK